MARCQLSSVVVARLDRAIQYSPQFFSSLGVAAMSPGGSVGVHIRASQYAQSHRFTLLDRPVKPGDDIRGFGLRQLPGQAGRRHRGPEAEFE
jgi:hypothetical protein